MHFIFKIMEKMKGGEIMEKPIVFTRKASGLVRELNIFDISIFLIGVTVGASIFMFAPGGVISFPGSNIPLAYLIVGVLMLPFVFTIGMTLNALPRSGGLYTIISRILHPTVGYMCGWFNYAGLGLIAGVVCYVAGQVAQAGLARIGISFGQTGLFVFAIVMVLAMWGMNVGGIRIVKYIERFLVVVPVAILLVVIIYMIAVGRQGAYAGFNQYFGANAMERIIDAAGKAGWKFPPFSLAATLSAFLAVIFAYGGCPAVAYLSGEMRAKGRTILYGLFWGEIIVIIFYLLIVQTAFSAFGDGIAAYAYLHKNDPKALAAILAPMKPASPSIPFFMLSLIKNNWLAFLVGVSIMMWPLNTAIPIFTAGSRALFAFSFDRAVPEKFSEVSRRGVPTYANYLTLLIAIGGVLFMFFRFGAVLGTLTMLVMPLQCFFGLSAMILPFVRPEVQERLPVKSKWVIVGLGLYSFLLTWFFMLIAGKELNLPMIGVILLIFFIGFILYVYQQNVNKKNGIELSQIFMELPPE
jgi:amino acid transporter